MNFPNICFLALCGFSLAACKTTTHSTATQTTAAPAASFASVSDAINAAECTTKADGIRRDKWLAAETPAWDVYVVAHNKNAQNPPEQSGVAMAYKAWLDAGKDHTKAAALFDSRHENWAGRYPAHAKCWVQYS